MLKKKLNLLIVYILLTTQSVMAATPVLGAVNGNTSPYISWVESFLNPIPVDALSYNSSKQIVSVALLRQEPVEPRCVGRKDTMQILKVGTKLNDEQFKKFLRSICVAIDSARIDNKSIPEFYSRFKHHGVYNGSEKDFAPFFHKYLNENKQKLICPEYHGIEQKHFYKRMLQSSLADFFEEYIIDPELTDLDLNAFEMVNGKKETLLDFINFQIKKKRGDPSTMVFIRDTLHDEFGAKFGAELD